MAEIIITSKNFEAEVLQSKLPVLLDFWASWCGPCRMLAPELEKLALEKEGELIVGKVNVDEEGELAARFGIMSIPTVMLFQEGKPVRTAIGYRPKEELEKLLTEYKKAGPQRCGAALFLILISSLPYAA